LQNTAYNLYLSFAHWHDSLTNRVSLFNFTFHMW